MEPFELYSPGSVQGRTLRELAEELGVEWATVLGWAARGEIEACVHGRDLLFGERTGVDSNGYRRRCWPGWAFEGTRSAKSDGPRYAVWREYGMPRRPDTQPTNRDLELRDRDRNRRTYRVRWLNTYDGCTDEVPRNPFEAAFLASDWLLIPVIESHHWPALLRGEQVLVRRFKVPRQAWEGNRMGNLAVLTPEPARGGGPDEIPWETWCRGLIGRSDLYAEVGPTELCVSPAERERIVREYTAQEAATLADVGADGRDPASSEPTADQAEKADTQAAVRQSTGPVDFQSQAARFAREYRDVTRPDAERILGELGQSDPDLHRRPKRDRQIPRNTRGLVYARLLFEHDESSGLGKERAWHLAGEAAARL